MEKKRSYTVPVLLLILVVLTTLIVMVYSKLLVAQQQQTTEKGKRLAEQYILANAFAERLSEGAALLRADATEAQRLRGKRLMGEADYPSVPTVAILTEAARRTSGQSNEEAFKPISVAMSKLSEKLNEIGEHDGAITAEEQRVLATVHAGAADMAEALHKFRPPTGDAGFRQMQAGGEWVAAVNDAAKALQDMAAKLK
ncbi:hypothetical protein E5161_05995 [Cohnella pontilimi]|uniref:Uncharacterized protein n=1 Tax=Cohnella pontilimi TaxID=2564100 RepID=A0A4U0FER1_9BACL|nr:hypothetical protein [Cohnella pontilimi]TJY43433.1 hypothetical protein E5161_05995 [Cohnella pontilimi]